MRDVSAVTDGNVASMHFVHCRFAQLIEQQITTQVKLIQQIILISFLIWMFVSFRLYNHPNNFNSKG
jgi:hypothetical protein